jgi:hypothetical protein
MTKQYTITLSNAEDKALSVFVLDQNEWIQNAIHERCRIAIEEIVNSEVQRKLALGENITGTKEDIVIAAPIETLAEHELRVMEELKILQEEQQG